ncbi:RraA family protein [Streptomyces sp. NPDC057580]|uniref:RraA family protein n=1 Tax=Streptomyces sp. NPDC057580 TaxID=3346173 RepID=UPI0036764202
MATVSDHQSTAGDITAADLAELARLGSATVHEAADRIGALPSAIKPVDPRWAVAGPAFPVSTPPVNNVYIHDALYAAPAGSILVVATGDGFEAGYWGEILSHAAVQRGMAAAVIDGGVRDAKRLCDQGFPVFSRGLCIQGTGKQRGAGTLGQPVRIGDVTISQGDLVVGDCDGVVVIPAGSERQVMTEAAAREAKETEILQRLSQGETSLDIYGF